MARVLVLYYSSYGHVERMAEAVAEGARSVAGTDVTIKRVPEVMSEEAARKAGMKVDQAAPVADPNDLADYDAIIFGTPTRFGNMAGQMRNFLDRTGNLWTSGALVGKIGSVFTSTASQHGGQETTLTSFHTTLLHQGMIIVGLPYSFAGQTRMRCAPWRPTSTLKPPAETGTSSCRQRSRARPGDFNPSCFQVVAMVCGCWAMLKKPIACEPSASSRK